MKKLFIQEHKNTPLIDFDGDKGLLEISGRSISENANEFYKPLLDILTKYISKPSSVTLVNIRLEYMNSGTVKCLHEIFKKLEIIPNAATTITVNWHFEADDENMRDVGESFKTLCKLRFVLVEVK